MRSLIVVLLLSVAALAQGVRYDSIAQSTTTVGSSTVVVPLSAATITVCGYPGTGGTPCTNKASVCTDSTMFSCSTSSGNPITADAQGNFGFWAAPGMYSYSVCPAVGTCATGYIADLVNSTSGYVHNNNFIFEGDSITAGTGVAAGSDYPTQLMAIAAPVGQYIGKGTAYNRAVAGSTVATMTARYAAQVYPLRPSSTVPRSVLHVLCGINDIGVGTSGATIFSNLQAYWATAKADGFTVVAYTMYHSVDTTAAQIAQLDILNAAIRGDKTYDYLVDLDALVQNTNDANLFQVSPNAIHMTAVGYTKLAALVNSTIISPFTKGPISKGNNLALGTGEVVGIGTQTPFKTLQSNLSSTSVTQLSNEAAILAYNPDTTVGNYAAYGFGAGSVSTSLISGRIAVENTGSGGKMHFQLSDNYASGITQEPLQCTYQNRCGVGNIAPTEVLDVNGNLRVVSQVKLPLATGTAPLVVTSTTPVANLTTVPATYNHSGTQTTAAHIVSDICTLGTNCVVTLVGSAIFTAAVNYSCSATDASAAAAVKVQQIDGSHMTFTGTGTDVIVYNCIGN